MTEWQSPAPQRASGGGPARPVQFTAARIRAPAMHTTCRNGAAEGIAPGAPDVAGSGAMPPAAPPQPSPSPDPSEEARLARWAELRRRHAAAGTELVDAIVGLFEVYAGQTAGERDPSAAALAVADAALARAGASARRDPR